MILQQLGEQMPTEEPSTTFKVLLIASEFLIPLIIFIGVYFIFKPVFGKDEKKKKGKDDESVNQSNRGADS